jgi:dsDNA-specific endonuclease/ATPase MutS2
MASPFAPGDTVQTPFGKGVVREVRNSGRLMVDVQGRAMVVREREISAVAHVTKRSRVSQSSENASERIRPDRDSRAASREIDLHGLTVEEALDRVELALDDALLADLSEIRFIHGRSGGRIRAALHRRLRDTPSVRGFRLDPRNNGVTLVNL